MSLKVQETVGFDKSEPTSKERKETIKGEKRRERGRERKKIIRRK